MNINTSAIVACYAWEKKTSKPLVKPIKTIFGIILCEQQVPEAKFIGFRCRYRKTSI